MFSFPRFVHVFQATIFGICADLEGVEQKPRQFNMGYEVFRILSLNLVDLIDCLFRDSSRSSNAVQTFLGIRMSGP